MYLIDIVLVSKFIIIKEQVLNYSFKKHHNN